jgi:hypothetical protein
VSCPVTFPKCNAKKKAMMEALRHEHEFSPILENGSQRVSG